MQILSQAQLLNQLSISRQTLYRMRQSGLKYIKVKSKLWFKADDVFEYLNQHSSHYQAPKKNSEHVKTK